MAHYAFLDNNSIVTEVITGKDETELIDGLDPETWYGNYRGQKCVRTSYNNNIRYNYAGIGYTYDSDADAFIAPRPQCGHTELFLNNAFKWNCQRCELAAKELLNAN
jgi:hypothetical protein